MGYIKDFLTKHRIIFLYTIFGILTTIINFSFFYLLYEIAQLSNISSNVIAWIIAVTFAFITNKLYVFKSLEYDVRTIIREGCAFIVTRLITGIIDIIIMYITVDVKRCNATLWKLISNCIVIICNYISSKMVIFRKH